MKNIAYLRISTNLQDLSSQRLAILDYANQHDIKIHSFIEAQVSSRKTLQDRKIDDLLACTEKDDCIIISELSRLGRSLSQIVRLIELLIQKQVKLIAIKESLILDKDHDIKTKVMFGMIALFAEIERDLISERTKQGIAAAKAKGKIVGRHKGTLGKSKLNGKEAEILSYLNKKVSISSIAKIMEISRTALISFIKSRQIQSSTLFHKK